MTLKKWMLKHKVSAAEMAEKLGVSDVSVYRYLNGAIPEVPVMKRVLKVTGGKVTPNDFFSSPAVVAAE